MRRRLEAYLDGELGPHEMEAARAHLDHCPACSQMLEERRAFGSFVREHLDVSAPPDLKAVILASGEDAVLSQCRTGAGDLESKSSMAGAGFWQRFFSGWSRRRVVPVLAGATTLLALVIGQRIISDGSDPGVTGETLAFSRPGRVIVFRYGEWSAHDTGEETLFGGLVLGDPR